MSEQEQIENAEETVRTFRLCFGNPAGQKVLTYLADFCRAAETCVAVPSRGAPIDLNRTLILEGRREVFLEIQKFLSLTPDELFLLATGRPYNRGEESDE